MQATPKDANMCFASVWSNVTCHEWKLWFQLTSNSVFALAFPSLKRTPRFHYDPHPPRDVLHSGPLTLRVYYSYNFARVPLTVAFVSSDLNFNVNVTHAPPSTHIMTNPVYAKRLVIIMWESISEFRGGCMFRTCFSFYQDQTSEDCHFTL